MITYQNENLRRIEILLEKLLLHFTGTPEEQPVVEEIEKCLKSIKKDDETLKGWNFI